MSFDHEAFLGELSRFASRLLTSYDVDETLQELAESLTTGLDLAGAGISLAHQGSLDCTTAVPRLVNRLEEVENVPGGGPAAAAYVSGSPVTVADLSVPDGAEGPGDDWTDYRVAARDVGVVATAAIPMRFGGESIGVVCLHDAKPRSWTEADVTALTVMADMATAYLINASKMQQQQQLSEQLQLALDSRVIIEQAKGIIASTRDIGVEEAFELIQRHARSHHTSIRVVADAVVNLGLRL